MNTQLLTLIAFLYILPAPTITNSVLHWNAVTNAAYYNVRFKMDGYEFLTLAETNHWKIVGMPAGKEVEMFVTAHDDDTNATCIATSKSVFYTQPKAPTHLRIEPK